MFHKSRLIILHNPPTIIRPVPFPDVPKFMDAEPIRFLCKCAQITNETIITEHLIYVHMYVLHVRNNKTRKMIGT